MKPARSHYLLLDDRNVWRSENARLAVGKAVKRPDNPLFSADRPWEVWFGNMYPNVIYDEAMGRYRCWYNPFTADPAYASVPPEARDPRLPPDHGESDYKKSLLRTMKDSGFDWESGRRTALCYAESNDGIEWVKPELDVVRWEGGRSNLLMLDAHGCGVFRDTENTLPAQRYKALLRNEEAGKLELGVSFSEDGITWSRPNASLELQVKGDTHNVALWSPELARYIGFSRSWDERVRLVVRSESEDFIHWTPPQEVLRGTAPERQIYSMPVFAIAGIYLGFPAVFDTVTDRVHTELAWSPDTVRWYRIDEGTAIIPTSDVEGAYDWGCVYAALAPVVRDGEIRLYYFGDQGLHTNWRGPRMGLCLATLPPDGFAGYEPVEPGRVAIVETTEIRITGRRLTICAAPRHGEVRVRLIDAGGSESGPSPTDASLSISPDQGLTVEPGRLVRLRFELRDAQLYSFGFSD